MKAAAAVSTSSDSLAGAAEAARAAARGLARAGAGSRADVAVVFASGVHLAAPERVLEAVHDELATDVLIGCGAGGVLGAGREYESETAVSVWAAVLEQGEARPFHATVSGTTGETGYLEGLPEPEPDSALILLTDPYSFPSEGVLEWLGGRAPAVPVLGGLSSARTPAGEAVLFGGETVYREGAVGLALQGVEMLPCVSQGAAPLGPEMTITAGEENVIQELAGQPAVAAIESAIGDLPPHERALIAEGLLIGIVIDGGKPDYEQGDFLVRGVLGADPDTGAISVGTGVQPGQVVRLHARDARSASSDLRRELRLRSTALGGEPPAGVLVFSCNGRGRAMFGSPHHDAALVDNELAGAPAAGFFAAGEIGPVGGRSFLHGFTATLAVFPQ